MRVASTSGEVRSLIAALAALSLSAMVTTGAHAASASVIYTYDDVGRVRTALYDNGTCIAYGYDANGNRTAQTNTTSGAPESPTWGAGVWGCFQWTAQSARLDRLAPGKPAREFAMRRRGVESRNKTNQGAASTTAASARGGGGGVVARGNGS